ncbi:MAG TPA: sigma-70 family RNA polymerase sigma factor [Gemmataceae bacterium]|nr:sigma-70 family RNA polymerase sigma factor [Gemmataceae bacterium]
MSSNRKLNRRRYTVAVVLGTALSALGSTPAAVAEAPATMRAVADMSRYCTSCWRNARISPDSWGDCTQEVLQRMLERVAPDAWQQVLSDDGNERREFLRAIDTVKKRSQRQRRPANVPLDQFADRRDSNERRLADDRETVRDAARELLSQRQQRIVQLSLEGWSVHDIAVEMRTGPERVSDEKYKAIRKLREYLKN